MMSKAEAARQTQENIRKYISKSENVLLAISGIDRKIESAVQGSSTVEPKFFADITEELSSLSREQRSYVCEQLQSVYHYRIWYLYHTGTYTIMWN